MPNTETVSYSRQDSLPPEEYTTKDMKLIVTLMARGHTPLSGGVRRSGSTLWFTFDMVDVSLDVQRFLSNCDMEIEAHALWRAWETFRANLRRMA